MAAVANCTLVSDMSLLWFLKLAVAKCFSSIEMSEIKSTRSIWKCLSPSSFPQVPAIWIFLFFNVIYEQYIHVFISSAPLPPGQGLIGQRQLTLQSFNIEHSFVVDIWNTRDWRGRVTLGSCLLPSPKTTLMVCWLSQRNTPQAWEWLRGKHAPLFSLSLGHSGLQSWVRDLSLHPPTPPSKVALIPVSIPNTQNSMVASTGHCYIFFLFFLFFLT